MPEFKNLWLFDKNKLSILYVLLNCKEEENFCGCDLVEKLDIPKNLLSYHIKQLREAGLIGEKKCGRNKNYFIEDKSRIFIEEILLVSCKEF